MNITRYEAVVSAQTAVEGVVTVQAKNVPLKGRLVVTKTVENADGTDLTAAQKNKEFSFTVTFSDGQSYPYTLNGGTDALALGPGGALTLKHGDVATFDTVPVGVVYTVNEQS